MKLKCLLRNWRKETGCEKKIKGEMERYEEERKISLTCKEEWGDVLPLVLCHVLRFAQGKYYSAPNILFTKFARPWYVANKKFVIILDSELAFSGTNSCAPLISCVQFPSPCICLFPLLCEHASHHDPQSSPSFFCDSSRPKVIPFLKITTTKLSKFAANHLRKEIHLTLTMIMIKFPAKL